MDMFAPLNSVMNRVRMTEKFSSREEQLAQAEQLGFDTSQVWYHGSAKTFDRFRSNSNPNLDLGPGIYLSHKPKVASDYSKAHMLKPNSKSTLKLGPEDRPQMYPVFIRRGPIWDWDKKDKMIEDAIPRYMKLHQVTEPEARAMVVQRTESVATGANAFLKSLGYIGGIDRLSAHVDQIVIFDSNNIRSIFGAFQKPKGKLHEDA